MDGGFSSEEEMEAFEMTDADMAREADPLGRKRRKRTKEEALYGVFYEGDGYDDEQRKSKPMDHRPMAFVAGASAVSREP